MKTTLYDRHSGGPPIIAMTARHLVNLIIKVLGDGEVLKRAATNEFSELHQELYGITETSARDMAQKIRRDVEYLTPYIAALCIKAAREGAPNRTWRTKEGYMTLSEILDRFYKYAEFEPLVNLSKTLAPEYYTEPLELEASELANNIEDDDDIPF